MPVALGWQTGGKTCAGSDELQVLGGARGGTNSTDSEKQERVFYCTVIGIRASVPQAADLIK